MDFLKKVNEFIKKRTALTVIIAVTGVSLLPFFLNIVFLKQLMWFGDSWDLLNQLQAQGYLSWIFSCFAENFVPIFKFFWISAVRLFGGSYFAMLSIIWVTHAINIFLLGLILSRIKIGLPGLAISVLLLGVSWTNIEMLTWSVQWSALLSVMFFLSALYVVLEMFDREDFNAARFLAYIIFLLCSVFSFSRGVLSGLILAVFCFVYGKKKCRKNPLQVKVCMAFSIGISIFTALIIYFFASGNHKSLLSSGLEPYFQIVKFGGIYFFLNPLFTLLGFILNSEFNFYLLLFFVLMKVLIIYLGWFLANSNQRSFILLFVLMDLCNAFLLGIGRYHTGLQAALSSRYQYMSYVCFAAPFAVVISFLIAKMHNRRLVMATVFFLCSAVLLYNLANWRRILPSWCFDRGTVARKLINDPKELKNMPGIPFLDNRKAIEIVYYFNLH